MKLALPKGHFFNLGFLTLCTMLGLGSCKTMNRKASAASSSAGIEKAARRGDVLAKSYAIKPDGTFHFLSVDGTQICYIFGSPAAPVRDFKIATNPKDAAGVYFVVANDGGSKIDDLWYVSQEKWQGNCDVPKSLLVKNISKFDSLNYADSLISVVTLSKDGSFQAFSETSKDKPAYPVARVLDYALNTCYGQEKKKLSQYTVLLKTEDGTVKFSSRSPSMSFLERQPFEEFIAHICQDVEEAVVPLNDRPCTGNWNGFFAEINPETKASILTSLVKGISSEAATQIVQCEQGFTRQPTSWNEFLQLLTIIELGCDVPNLMLEVQRHTPVNKQALGCPL
jgi:hypothetical protein